jgi:hypothetical protein
VLPRLRESGAIGLQRDTVRVIELRTGPWVFRHWTPFNELTAGEASSPGYRRAIERQRSQSEMPYGLDVWHGERVLRVLWADDGEFAVPIFIRGEWEAEALALS